ncbi:AraC family transcriptional regulator [Wenyingzhuangia sp. 2_MG-2023]|uniref:AraC family transcriptional regulator n=1 Tax=Wenyingzhuangia sp. 2_MG-2023 TaxID=3062639 RepID=UPI0026E49224|nr:AraC family transcriptional regulator [Wenyingzhuangia sp. 2_MG-2023]MDO6738672.1 AraC family transcriptional regulator [Wenyingzhuangia sp. 2_MG-2023]
MKILQKKITPSNKSFSVYKNNKPYLDESWHLHQELELIYIIEGEGTCFIGDNVHEFKAGELSLIGSNMPHLWRNSDEYHKDINLKAEVIVLHFNEDFLGKDFFEKTEMVLIKNLISKASNGIAFLADDVKSFVAQEMSRLLTLTGFKSIACLLGILDALASTKDIKEFASNGYTEKIYVKDSQRLEKVYQFVLENLGREIHLDEVAEIAHLGVSPFCRFFKKRMHKTFSQFLNEVRVGHACKLLIENKLSISEVTYSCGYNSQTNFNRQFKKIKGINPKAFQKMYLGN